MKWICPEQRALEDILETLTLEKYLALLNPEICGISSSDEVYLAAQKTQKSYRWTVKLKDVSFFKEFSDFCDFKLKPRTIFYQCFL